MAFFQRFAKAISIRIRNEMQIPYAHTKSTTDICFGDLKCIVNAHLTRLPLKNSDALVKQDGENVEEWKKRLVQFGADEELNVPGLTAYLDELMRVYEMDFEDFVKGSGACELKSTDTRLKVYLIEYFFETLFEFYMTAAYQGLTPPVKDSNVPGMAAQVHGGFITMTEIPRLDRISEPFRELKKLTDNIYKSNGVNTAFEHKTSWIVQSLMYSMPGHEPLSEKLLENIEKSIQEMASNETSSEPSAMKFSRSLSIFIRLLHGQLNNKDFDKVSGTRLEELILPWMGLLNDQVLFKRPKKKLLYLTGSISNSLPVFEKKLGSKNRKPETEKFINILRILSCSDEFEYARACHLFSRAG